MNQLEQREELVRKVHAISKPLPHEYWAELKSSGIIPKEAPVDKVDAST